LNTPKEFNGEPVNDYSLSKKVKRNSCLNSSAAILVADNIASWYNSAKGYAAVSVTTLIDGTGLSRRTIYRALEAIEASGEWVVEKTDGQRNKYFPNLDLLFDDNNRSRKVTVKTNRGAAGREALRLKREKENVQKDVSTAPVVSDAYVFTSTEDTDPVLDGKPLYAPVTTDGFQPPVCVPKYLKTALGCAERLFRRVPVTTRNRKAEWTVSHILAKYETLISQDYPLAAIDILMWLQAEGKQALDVSFLATVLSMCTQKSEIIEPIAFKESDMKTNPALSNAMMVYRIYKARESSGNSTSKKYVEAL
jgi:hypothetical protein